MLIILNDQDKESNCSKKYISAYYTEQFKHLKIEKKDNKKRNWKMIWKNYKTQT